MAGYSIFLRTIHKTRLKPATLYLLAAVLLTFLAWQPFNTATQKDYKKAFLHQGAGLQLVQVHLPFQAHPLPADRDIPNENEQEDNWDDDSNSNTNEVSRFNILKSSQAKNWWRQCSAFVYNCNSVPLFILYHSWKSFIC